MIHKIFLTIFGCGTIKKAPGTFGSLVSLVIWFFVTKYFYLSNFSIFSQNIFWFSLLIIVLIYGSYAIKIYSKNFDDIDHKSIVLDELLGQILTLQITLNFIHRLYFSNQSITIFHLVLCFIFFRFFDIVKPSIIGYCDKNFKSGFGVMFDDLLSGVFAGIFVATILKFILLVF